ncbi:trigger factor [Deinococcus cellulosilyticus]|uniref:Trigger factor n=1 Tax=Deinococcus cellulosilyticus (strain DSM 18568 / NBRC 106333 / KACC 11606 / 5516J-15) TaxID=1223518 RepID=A0A511NB02_DEIC1|nr:trigger factor [Deinococcus cellulosilyticus]GEM50005.1 trigger factor [Deinococcus cellulosilyticus NBRC 106333 = KACC 11606]
MAELIKNEGNQVEFKVTVPAKEVNTAYNAVIGSLTKQVKVPGFRPGKAPKSVVVKRVGQDYVDNEVRDQLLQNHYPKALQELNLAIVDAEIHPEGITEGQDFNFTVKAEKYPEVKLPEWQSLELTSAAPEITDEIVTKTLGDLTERNATFENVDRPAEEGDMLIIEEQGEEGGSYPVYLDTAEAHIKTALLGKKAGEDVTIEVPEVDHGDHKHEAQTVQVKIKEIKKKNLPELNDEFAKTFKFDTLEALRDAIKRDLTTRAEQEGKLAQREEFAQKLADGMEVNVPSSLVKRRKESMLSEIKSDLQRQGVKFEEYEKFMTEQGKFDDFIADLDKNAMERVRRELALEQLVEDLKIDLTRDELNGSLVAFAQQNRTTVQELLNQLGSSGLEGFKASVRRDKAVAQAIATLEKAAQKEEPKAEAAEAQAPQEEAAQPEAEAEAPKAEAPASEE